MKINFTPIFLVIVLGSTILYSQGRMSHEERMENLNEKLNLSEEQYTEIDSILIVQSKEFQILREEADGDREQMRENAMELMKEADEQITELLNEEQIKDYEKYKEERMQNRRRR